MVKKNLLSGFFIGVLVTSVVGLSGCSSFEQLATDTYGEISVMSWGGDGNYIEDIGHKTYTQDDLTGAFQAEIYAAAKEFNKIYPNIKVNVYAKAGGPNDGGVSWIQERENFRAAHGRYPSMWNTEFLAEDVKLGVVADLSVFKDDPMYKTFNPGIMQMLNYYGVQAGLPSYIFPWGVFVNRGLAEQNNIDVPGVDWTLEEYTDFVTSGDNVNFFGSMDVNFGMIDTGVNTIAAQVVRKMAGAQGDYVNFDSAEVRDLLTNVDEWASSAVWPQRDLGNVSDEFMNASWWWGHKMFVDNKILVNAGDPWMIGSITSTDTTSAYYMTSDWDFYPRPSTKYKENTVGVVMDPMAFYNTCADDGVLTCNEGELQQLKLAYTFYTFWKNDPKSWEAIANQRYKSGSSYVSPQSDSLPLVTGAKFDELMTYYYMSPGHARLADKEVMPGWHEILRLWNKGQIWDYSGKAVPSRFTENGEGKDVLYEWYNIWDPKVVTGDPEATGPLRHEAAWQTTVISKLPAWNTAFNERFTLSNAELKQALKDFYGLTDKQLQ